MFSENKNKKQPENKNNKILFSIENKTFILNKMKMEDKECNCNFKKSKNTKKTRSQYIINFLILIF